MKVSLKSLTNFFIEIGVILSAERPLKNASTMSIIEIKLMKQNHVLYECQNLILRFINFQIKFKHY